MCHKEADIIANNAVSGKQNVKKCHIHGICQNVIPDTGCLLTKTFDHSIRYTVAVEKNSKWCKPLQILSGVCVIVQRLT